MDQSNLLETMVEFNDKSRPRSKKGKGKKEILMEIVDALHESRELILNAFKSGISLNTR